MPKKKLTPGQILAALCHASMTRAQRVARAKKANAASQAAKKAKKAAMLQAAGGSADTER